MDAPKLLLFLAFAGLLGLSFSATLVTQKSYWFHEVAGSRLEDGRGT